MAYYKEYYTDENIRIMNQLMNKDLIMKFLKRFYEINKNRFLYSEYPDEKILLNIIHENKSEYPELNKLENRIILLCYNSIDENESLKEIYESFKPIEKASENDA